MGGKGGGFSDFFNMFFGGMGNVGQESGQARRQRRGQDYEYPVEITLEEACTGTQRVLEMTGDDGKPKRLEVKIPAGVDTGSRPGVTVNQEATQPDPTNTGPINFTVVFSEPVSGFTNADLVGNFGGTAAPTTAIITTGSGATYNVAISGMAADGTVTLNLPAGIAQDGTGNSSTASTSTDNTVTYDTTRPTVTINQAVAQIDPTSLSPINFTVVFSEPVNWLYQRGY